MPVERQVRQ